MKYSRELLQAVKEIRHVALDMDGTIYNGSTLFPFTIPFLNKLNEMGIGYSFLTNNSSKSVDDYMTNLNRLGIPARDEDMYTSSKATIEYLKINYPHFKRLFLLGTPSMVNEFEKAGYISTQDDPEDRPDAVIVAFDSSLVYSRLCRASWWVKEGLPYIATNPDKVCPTDKQVVLVDCAAICAAIHESTGRMPDLVIGKPDPRMLDGILNRNKLQPHEVAIVGDRIYTDVRTAKNAKAMGVLVMSGETDDQILEASDIIPDIVARDLEEFGSIIEASRLMD
ncbi:MAG: HAD-IIA family hydrolase [Bacteroidales bacterium]